jgi:hypothetical protein
MREGAPRAIDVPAERVAMQDNGRDVQERTLHVRHMHGHDIKVNGGDVQTLEFIPIKLQMHTGPSES